jgi:hypothetical protein
MFGPDVSVVERLGLFGGERQDSFDAWSVRDVADQFSIEVRADPFLDLQPHGVQVKAHLPKP